MERWEIVLLSLGWFLVYEGLLPAFFTRQYREGIERLRALPDRALRNVGLFMLIVGLGIVWAV